MNRSDNYNTPTLLHIAVSPLEEDSLDVGVEQDIIQDAISNYSRENQVSYQTRTRVSKENIISLFNNYNPLLVHFSGHGCEEGLELFDNDPLSTNELVAIVRNFSDSLKCVVLLSCESAKVAEQVSKEIAYAIGFPDTIEDAHVPVFVKCFYDSLFSGKSVRQAFDLALLQSKMENLPLRPQLFINEGYSGNDTFFNLGMKNPYPENSMICTHDDAELLGKRPYSEISTTYIDHLQNEKLKSIFDKRNQGLGSIAWNELLGEIDRLKKISSEVTNKQLAKCYHFAAIWTIEEAGNIQKANSFYNEAEKYEPGRKARRLNSLLLAREEKIDEAIEALQPFDHEDYFATALTLLFNFGRGKEAERLMEQYPEFNEKSLGIKSATALCKLQVGDFDEAIRLQRLAIEEKKDYSHLQLLLGYIEYWSVIPREQYTFTDSDLFPAPISPHVFSPNDNQVKGLKRAIACFEEAEKIAKFNCASNAIQDAIEANLMVRSLLDYKRDDFKEELRKFVVDYPQSPIGYLLAGQLEVEFDEREAKLIGDAAKKEEKDLHIILGGATILLNSEHLDDAEAILFGKKNLYLNDEGPYSLWLEKVLFLYTKQNRLDEFPSLIDSFWMKGKDNFRRFRAEAAWLSAKDNKSSLEATLIKLVEMKGEMIDYLNLCHTLRKQFKWNDLQIFAEDGFKKFEDLEFVNLLGLSSLSLGFYQLTLQLFEHNSTRYPNSKLSRVALDICIDTCLKMKDPFRGAIYAQQKYDLEKSSQTATKWAFFEYSKGDKRKSLRILERAIDEELDGPEIQFQIAILTRGSDPTRAFKSSAEAVKADPENPEYALAYINANIDVQNEDGVASSILDFAMKHPEDQRLVQGFSVDDLVNFVKDHEKAVSNLWNNYVSGVSPLHSVLDFTNRNFLHVLGWKTKNMKEDHVDIPLLTLFGGCENQDVKKKLEKGVLVDLHSLLIANRIGLLDFIDSSDLNIFVQADQAGSLLMDLDSVRSSLEQRFATEIEELIDKICNGKLSVKPFLNAPESKENAQNILGRQTKGLFERSLVAKQHGLSLWCDDRCVSSFNSIDEVPIVGIMDILEYLFDSKCISIERYEIIFRKLIELKPLFIMPPTNLLEKLYCHDTFDPGSENYLAHKENIRRIRSNIFQHGRKPLPHLRLNEIGSVLIHSSNQTQGILKKIWESSDLSLQDKEKRSSYFVNDILVDLSCISVDNCEKINRFELLVQFQKRLLLMGINISSHGKNENRFNYFCWLYKDFKEYWRVHKHMKEQVLFKFVSALIDTALCKKQDEIPRAFAKLVYSHLPDEMQPAIQGYLFAKGAHFRSFFKDLFIEELGISIPRYQIVSWMDHFLSLEPEEIFSVEYSGYSFKVLFKFKSAFNYECRLTFESNNEVVSKFIEDPYLLLESQNSTHRNIWYKHYSRYLHVDKENGLNTINKNKLTYDDEVFLIENLTSSLFLKSEIAGQYLFSLSQNSPITIDKLFPDKSDTLVRVLPDSSSTSSIDIEKHFYNLLSMHDFDDALYLVALLPPSDNLSISETIKFMIRSGEISKEMFESSSYKLLARTQSPHVKQNLIHLLLSVNKKRYSHIIPELDALLETNDKELSLLNNIYLKVLKTTYLFFRTHLFNDQCTDDSCTLAAYLYGGLMFDSFLEEIHNSQVSINLNDYLKFYTEVEIHLLENSWSFELGSQNLDVCNPLDSTWIRTIISPTVSLLSKTGLKRLFKNQTIKSTLSNLMFFLDHNNLKEEDRKELVNPHLNSIDRFCCFHSGNVLEKLSAIIKSNYDSTYSLANIGDIYKSFLGPDNIDDDDILLNLCEKLASDSLPRFVDIHKQRFEKMLKNIDLGTKGSLTKWHRIMRVVNAFDEENFSGKCRKDGRDFLVEKLKNDYSLLDDVIDAYGSSIPSSWTLVNKTQSLLSLFNLIITEIKDASVLDPVRTYMQRLLPIIPLELQQDLVNTINTLGNDL